MLTGSSGRGGRTLRRVKSTGRSYSLKSPRHSIPCPTRLSPLQVTSTPSEGRVLHTRFPQINPRYLFYLYSPDLRSEMTDHHVRPHARDQRDQQAISLRSRSSSRDMSWRKPVPKFIPSPPLSPNQLHFPQYTESPTSTTFGFTMDRANPFSMSLTSLNNDMPPVCGGPRGCLASVLLRVELALTALF